MASTTISIPEDNVPVRRIVTGHTLDGKAVVLDDSLVELDPTREPPHVFADIYWSESNPDKNAVDWKDVTRDHSTELVGRDGSSARVIQVPPGAASEFHRTVTLDYGIVIKGEITLILDDNKRVKLHAGDVVVQRGTIHGWYNESSEWTHMFFVMIPAQKVVVGNKPLEEECRPLQK